jgi:hypothetical protein
MLTAFPMTTITAFPVSHADQGAEQRHGGGCGGVERPWRATVVKGRQEDTALGVGVQALNCAGIDAGVDGVSAQALAK